ncbi:MAG: hypothetical protein K0S12_1929 [Bacteroidetes bacterium]|jgi:hypothetical protein|nr:hypothetical protein [Bacteroidota bacterium]
MLIRVSLIITFFFLLAASCRKKEEQKQSNHPVPYVPVDFTIYPGDPLNFKIQSIGGWQYFNGGINGVIVYRKSQQEFVAIERTSSYLPDNPEAKVKVQSDNFTLRDTISNSKWQIVDGTVITGPAEWALRVYGTSYDGNALRIRN